jgi:RNA polymerase sigma-70 factor (ECF subfamily)
VNWLERASPARARRLVNRSQDERPLVLSEVRRTDEQSVGGRTISKGEFEALALPHAPALYRTAYHLAGNAFEAEDLTQETFLRAFRGIGGFRGGDLRAWLFAILRHAFLDECRRRGRSPLVEYDIDEGTETLAASVPSAEIEALRDMPNEEVARALAALPEDWRMIVMLADVEGFSYREIANAMEIPLGTVMSRLHRARRRLYDLMLASDHSD